MSGSLSRRVGEDEAGIRLDVFLARQPEIASRSRAKELVQGGRVRVGGVPVTRAGLNLTADQHVEFDPLEVQEPDPLGDPGTPPPEVRVLYRDEWIAAIAKPAGLPAHRPEDRHWRGHSVASVARALFGALPELSGSDRPGIVHRLDRDTTGVMLVALTEPAFHNLRAQFAARSVRKEYRCIAHGVSRFDSDWVERSIGTDPNHPDRMAVVATGREASTYYEVLERFAGFTHFRCLPKSGRTHQIRVHMAAVGHSLVGDRLYRPRRAQLEVLPPDAPDPGRHCLHALRLQVAHPCTGEELEFEAPMPDDMAALLRWLREQRPEPV